MNGEIVVPETPNWLNDLEAKRERRVKARLGHEAGAGAPCLKCGDKCPGLDLHFWRKACKACRCPKEEHDVPDDDIYGWAQFQLLGSKPNKIKTKIVLPGKNDEVELEWAPKGQKDTIDKYLKTLPPEALPVKGSQAAQERKQLLQKQIPVHDIDPTLCHELNEEEVAKMEEYIAHIKKSSVGVGQIVNLSSVIKANLHNISPQEAHIIASRYSTGVPFSEIIKLQTGLAQNLENLSLNNPKSTKNQPPLQTMQPNIPGNITEENMQNSLTPSKFKDITHPWYTNSSPGKGALHPQYSEQFKSRQPSEDQTPYKHGPGSDYALDQKLLQGTNFDPSKTPSQFSGYRTPGYRPGLYGGPPTQDQYPDPNNQDRFGYDSSSNQQPPGEVLEGDVKATSVPYGNVSVEATRGGKPNFSQNIHGAGEQYGFENPYFNQNRKDPQLGPNSNTAAQKKLPGYSPSKFDTLSETQDPKAPKSMKDLMYSTYDPSKGPIPEDEFENIFGKSSVDPRIPGYDPNAVFSTYKHDPSVFHSEPLSLPEKNISVPGDGRQSYNKTPFNPDGTIKNDQFANDFRNYDPQNPTAKRELPRYDPVTGKYIPEDHRYPESGRNASTGDQYSCGPNNAQQSVPQSLPEFDPITGKFIPEDQRYPKSGIDVSSWKQYPFGSDNVQQTGSHGPHKFDPITGKYILEDQRYPKYGIEDSSAKQHPHRLNNDQQTGPYGPHKFDPITGKYIPIDPESGSDISNRNQYPYMSNNMTQPGSHGLRKFDPITGKYIQEDQKYPDSSGYQNLYGPDATKPGLRKFDPVTGKYIIEDNRYPESGYKDKQYPYASENPAHSSSQGKGIFNPKTGQYVPEDECTHAGGDRYGPNESPNRNNVADNIRRFNHTDPGSEKNNPYAGHTQFSPSKSRKPLESLQPGHINVPEDYLEPHMVNIGSIQDINPEVRAATTQLNPGYDEDSLYGDNGAEYSPESIREILNNIKLPDCHYCKKAFEENEFAVTIDRANVLFHAQCFRCAGCNLSLADNIYFYHKESNNVYCGRDYAKIKGYPRCTACDELIFTKEYCLAENATFHLKHFCCFQCDTPLAGQDYTLEDDKPYCLPCYETSKAAKCSTCELVIKPDEVGCQLNGVHFHAEDRCFRCIVCSLPLMGKKFLLRNEKLYCSHDCFNTGKK